MHVIEQSNFVGRSLSAIRFDESINSRRGNRGEKLDCRLIGHCIQASPRALSSALNRNIPIVIFPLLLGARAHSNKRETASGNEQCGKKKWHTKTE